MNTSGSTNTSCNPLETNLEFLRSLIAFAYEQGYHEHGYDVLEETLSQLYTKADVEALAAIAVAGARHVAQDCDGPGEEDGPWAEGYAQRTACLPLEPAGWQPIATAPKDGTFILAISEGHGTPFIGYWCDDKYAKKPRPYWSGRSVISKSYDRSMQPTHWMQLLPPPGLGLTKGENNGT